MLSFWRKHRFRPVAVACGAESRDVVAIRRRCGSRGAAHGRCWRSSCSPTDCAVHFVRRRQLCGRRDLAQPIARRHPDPSRRPPGAAQILPHRFASRYRRLVSLRATRKSGATAAPRQDAQCPERAVLEAGLAAPASLQLPSLCRAGRSAESRSPGPDWWTLRGSLNTPAPCPALQAWLCRRGAGQVVATGDPRSASTICRYLMKLWHRVSRSSAISGEEFLRTRRVPSSPSSNGWPGMIRPSSGSALWAPPPAPPGRRRVNKISRNRSAGRHSVRLSTLISTAFRTRNVMLSLIALRRSPTQSIGRRSRCIPRVVR